MSGILWFINELTSINIMKVTHRYIFLKDLPATKTEGETVAS